MPNTNNSINDTTQKLTITAGNLTLVNTNTSGTSGVIVFGGNRFISNYGTNNTFLGQTSGNTTVAGGNNVGMGTNALLALTTGSNNTAVGYSALTTVSTGGYNTAVGVQALFYNISGNDNTAVGGLALLNNTASQNTAVGSQALLSNTGGSGNVAVGFQALLFNTTGLQNVAMGVAALQYNTAGQNNVGVGFGALVSNTTGNYNQAIGTYALAGNTAGGANVAIGGFALGGNTTGSNNSGIGNNALRQNSSGTLNTAIGYMALGSITTGGSNVGIGASAGNNYTGGESNNIIFNNFGIAGENNTTRIGTQGTQTACYLAGVTGVSVVNTSMATIDTSSGQLGNTPYVLGGSFTPGVAFGGSSTGITYTTQTGEYTQIGNTVFFTITIAMSNVGSSTGNATITGLPVSIGGASTRGVSAFAGTFAYTTYYTNLTFQATSGTILQLRQISPTLGQISANNSNFSVTPTSFSFTGFYFTS